MKKRVLFLVESLAGGGAEKVLTTIVRHIDKERFDVTVCSIVESGVYCKEIEQYVNTHYIIRKAGNSLWQNIVFKLKYHAIYKLLSPQLIYRLFIPKLYDVEIAFVEGTSTKIMARSYNRRSKKIAWIHTDLSFNPWTQLSGVFSNIEEESKAYHAFDTVVSVSKTVQKNFIQTYRCNSTILYNPIDPQEIILKSKELQNDFIDKSVINIVTSGRFIIQKGFDRLLNVAKRLKDEHFRFKIHILGDGALRGDFEKYIAENWLDNFVKLYGFKSNPYPLMSKCDVFVCSSRAEGFSLVIAEAMILGLPIVSTYCSGPNELLCEGKYGILTENSTEGLYNGLRQIIVNHDLRQSLKSMSHEASKTFNIDNSLDRIHSLLDSVNAGS